MAREYPDAAGWKVIDLVTRYLRRPSDYYSENGALVLVFDPVLTVQEQAALDVIQAMARSKLTDLTPAQYGTIRTNLQTLRAIRQPGRNAFMALTAAERDRLTWDAIDATLTILLAMLREP